MTKHTGRMAAAAALAALLTLAACADDSDTSSAGTGPDAGPTETASASPTAAAVTFPLTVKNCGNDITFKKRPESVLTTSMPAVEFMVAAGAADKLTHRSGEYGTPLRGDATVVKDVPNLQSDPPSREVILGTGADMTLGYSLNNISQESIAKSGVASLLNSSYCGGLEPGTKPVEGLTAIGSIYSDLELLGKIFGTEDAAAASIDKIKSRIKAVQDSFDPGDFKTALVLDIYDRKNPYTYGTKSLHSEQLELLGLTNAVTEDKGYIPLSLERMIDLDPDILLVPLLEDEQGLNSPEETIAAVKSLTGVSDMKAVKGGNFVIVRGGAEPTPFVADGFESIAEQITALKENR